MDVTSDNLARYLAEVLREPVTVRCWRTLGATDADQKVKSYGYGVPIRIDYQTTKNGNPRTAVLHSMTPGGFGHENMEDRARILLWQHRAFGKLPRHIRALDIGGFRDDGSLRSIADVREFCLLTEYAEGEGYFRDLERLRDTNILDELDIERCIALCDYLVQIHQTRNWDAGMYERRIRELVGDGECIMGLIDAYPAGDRVFTPESLQHIEQECVGWRWKLRGRTHRLRQVHGDFHPWNILFQTGTDFTLLDRSRGEFGDPADDVSCLTLNYVFFALQRNGRLEGPFETLFRLFWDRYLEKSGDRELLDIAAPYFVFRALVMANPLWYPNLPDGLRSKLRSFIMAVLENPVFNPAEVNAYCEA